MADPKYAYYCSSPAGSGVQLTHCYADNDVMNTGYYINPAELGPDCRPGCSKHAFLPASVMRASKMLPVVPTDKNPRLSSGWYPYTSDTDYFGWVDELRPIARLSSAIDAIGKSTALEAARQAAVDAKATSDQPTKDGLLVKAWDSIVKAIEDKTLGDATTQAIVASMPPQTSTVRLDVGLLKDTSGKPDPRENGTLITWNTNHEYAKMWLLRQTYGLVLYLAARS